MEVVALIVIFFATIASIVVAALTLREMSQDNDELSTFVGIARLPLGRAATDPA